MLLDSRKKNDIDIPRTRKMARGSGLKMAPAAKVMNVRGNKSTEAKPNNRTNSIEPILL
jgi:hypothetical protein